MGNLPGDLIPVKYPFLAGDEMGKRTREKRVGKNTLGVPDIWPTDLRIILNTLFRQKYPKFLSGFLEVLNSMKEQFLVLILGFYRRGYQKTKWGKNRRRKYTWQRFKVLFLISPSEVVKVSGCYVMA